jgi:hypothetical protein
VGNEFPVWPLFLFAGIMTAIAGGIFVAIFISARNERQDGPR